MNQTLKRSGSMMTRTWLGALELIVATGALLGADLAGAEAPVAAAVPGTPVLALGAYDIAAFGYEVKEFSLSGTARSFRLEGEAGSDGGLDVPVDWVTVHRELVRGGYAYVAVSAQKVGIDGGSNLGRGSANPLKTADPQRYDLARISYPDTPVRDTARSGDDAMKMLLPMMSYAVIPNITYRTVDGWQGKLDVMSPRGLKGPNATLIYYHGGGWKTSSKEERMPLLLPYLQMGWTIINVEYRLSDAALAPAAVEDARCALRWVYQNADQTLQTSSGPVPLNIDLNRLVTSGTSAGGHLALVVGMAPISAGLDDTCGTHRSEMRVAAVVDWFGISDVHDLLDIPEARALAAGWLGDGPNQRKLAKLVSPITYVRKDLPPIISIHGDADPGVPYAQKLRFHQELERVGAPHELITIEGGGHGVFSTADYLRAYAAIRAFLTKHVTPPF